MPRIIDWDCNILNAQTINAGTAVICLSEVIDTSVDASMLFEGYVEGLSTDGDMVVMAAYCFAKIVGGVLTVNVVPQKDIITAAEGGEAALAAAVVSFDTAGGRVRFLVTGVVGKTINYFSDVRSRIGPG